MEGSVGKREKASGFFSLHSRSIFGGSTAQKTRIARKSFLSNDLHLSDN